MSKHRCPICESKDLVLRHESTFVYSYNIDDDAPGKRNGNVFKSFQYDKREEKAHREYIECEKCGAQYPASFIFHVLEEDVPSKKKKDVFY